MASRFKVVKQRDSFDCGPACLSAISAYFGRPVSVTKIRFLSGTNNNGTSLRALKDAAIKLGFAAKGVAADLEKISNCPYPLIAHVTVGGQGHFWVLYKCREGILLYMDPADGRLHKIAISKFQQYSSGKLLLLDPLWDIVLNKSQSIIDLKEIIPFIKPQIKWMLVLILTGLVLTILGFTTAVYLQTLIDHILPQRDNALLYAGGCVMVICIILQVLIAAFRSVISVRMGRQLDESIMLHYYKKAIRLPQKFFDNIQIGELIGRFSDAAKIRSCIQELASNMIVNLFIFVCSIVVMIMVSWKLTLVMLCAMPFFCAIFYIGNRVNRIWNARLMESAATLETSLIQNFRNFSTIKVFGIENAATAPVRNDLLRLMDKGETAARYNICLDAFTDLFSRLIILFILWIGAIMVVDSKLTTGELMFFFSVGTYFIGALLFFSHLPLTLQDAAVAKARLFEIIELDQAEAPGIELEPSVANTNDIYVKQLSFCYANYESVFKELSITFHAGKFTVLTGDCGSGKSTLLAILMGIYPADDGDIVIGNRSLQVYSMESIRKQIALVPRQTEIFSGSLLGNIVLGDVSPDIERVRLLAAMVGFDAVVDKFPDGYNQELRTVGCNLSGGQLQLLSIVRALYRNPDVLLLDEPTAHLDAGTEEKVLQTLKWYNSFGKTIVFVSHHSKKVVEADHTFRLNNGKAFAVKF